MILPQSACSDEFRAALRTWFLRVRRDLPWRRERSVYRTVVSEFMLQQTQVDTVIPYFENWIRNWKNFDELAAADEADVLRAWEGLGYYSRAKNLLGVARRIAEEKRGPASVEAWREFRGIGAYTAAAIASISQGVPAAVVDGNVVRILARLSGDEREFRDSASAATEFAALANSVLDGKNPGDHNEAMMELGALICSRRSPRCEICPVKNFCAARARGIEESLPKFPPKKMKKVEVVRLWCRVGNEVLLVRNAAGTRRLKNLCEFPRLEDFAVPAKTSAKWKRVFEGKRGIADESITERFLCVPEKFAGRLEKTFSSEQAELFRAGTEELEKLTLSGPHRKWLRELLKISA
ncbi:MAG: A/G-specific adenine glycosylase [Opitutales bacterium]|nr:A/G-specific adenine glycosylase [Opitutales bacterium]